MVKSRNRILDNIEKLIDKYKNGDLGGEVMPEDANPNLEKSSIENYLYFTLPMALNYQRNSYTLWEAALKTYLDEETRFVFHPKSCLEKKFEEVQYALTKYKVVLQKQKQTEIWITLCETLVELLDGDIRQLFEEMDSDVDKIRDFVQKQNKKKFPYLSGTKICNYWLYVIWQYTDREYKNLGNLTVAPDTHVCKSTLKLGLITEEEFQSSKVQQIVIDKWQELLKNTKYKPIDIHTPLWLWSRSNFPSLEKKVKLKDILETCQYVSSCSLHVKIKEDKIDQLLRTTNFKKANHWLSSNPFDILNLEVCDIVNFLVIFDSIDCSFWGNPKWTVLKEEEKVDGAFALMYCLLMLRKKKGHLNFEKITYQEFSKALQGNVEIPFLQERYQVVKEISTIINTKMKGNFYHFIQDIKTDRELFSIITEFFPSFQDERIYNKQTIYFYKLAQLLVSDILHVRGLKEKIEIDVSSLVGCADYKIPQVLRGLGILEYDKELSDLVNQKEEILENSKYEVEIRANMIVALDRIRKRVKDEIPSIDINDFIWSLGQNKEFTLKPYHLTRTMSY